MASLGSDAKDVVVKNERVMQLLFCVVTGICPVFNFNLYEHQKTEFRLITFRYLQDPEYDLLQGRSGNETPNPLERHHCFSGTC